MKVTGAEFMLWYDTAFPAGFYHECDTTAGGTETHNPDGSWALDPTKMYDLEEDLGYLQSDTDHMHQVGLDVVVRKWRKERDFVLMEVPKKHEQAVKELLKTLAKAPTA